LQVIPKIGGGFNYYNLTYINCRSNIDNTEFGYRKENVYGVFEDWQYYEAFNSNKTDKATIFFYKENNNCVCYPLPSWNACNNWIESDIEISKATLTKALTGFSATKMVTFFGVQPKEEEKESLSNKVKNKFNGSEGETTLINFAIDKEQAPVVEDLGVNDLTKDDFTNFDNLVTSKIFAGHGVTHPLLFGIQQAGKLGNSSELKIAFDIFKNTYATAKQKNLENLVKYFATIAGVNSEFKLKDIEPVGLDLNPIDFKEVLPKEWIFEKLGLDATKYGIVSPTAATQPIAATNDVLTNLTGRQRQNIMAIVRQFGQGKLTKPQAAIMLKNGFGFNDSDVNDYLGIDEDPNTIDTKFSVDENEDIRLALMFNETFEDASQYEVIKKTPLSQDENFEFQLMFAAQNELTELETKVKDLLQTNPKLSNENLATSLMQPLTKIDEIVKGLIDKNIIERLKSGEIKVIVKTPKVELPKIVIRYSYEKRSEASGADILPTSRPFCKKLVEMSNNGKFWSLKNIQAISQAVGYNVFQRAGGWWNNNGKIEPQCRHEWVANAVIKKTNNE
jgi:hypothetical protein